MIVGWDIGGVNTKLAAVRAGTVVAWRQEAFELQRDPSGLAALLVRLLAESGVADVEAHAVTMTAELSQMFRTKRDGVAFVLDAVEHAFPGVRVAVYATDGAFLTPGEARARPLAVAAANWAASARAVARMHPDAILIDVGTTTSDVVPIADGQLRAVGWTDPARLASGELVYAGVLRTPVEALVSSVPLDGAATGVSAEGFALAGDVYVWRGELDPDDYTVATPDGRSTARVFAGERLARIVCADREMVDDAAISAMADAVAEAQVSRLAGAVTRVRSRGFPIDLAVVTGLGAFVGARAARRAGLQVVFLEDEVGPGARCAPAVSVATLLEAAPPARRAQPQSSRPLTVVKVGGGLMASRAMLDAVLAAIDAARDQRLVIVPGGGRLADAVREMDRHLEPGDSAAHWMAVMAMDQVAHVLAARLPNAALVEDAAGIAHALDSGRCPVLAPYRWLRAEDPLPHSWDVTSDSIAAWVARRLRATNLVLVKPPGAHGDAVTDPWFPRAVSAPLSVSIVAADEAGGLARALRATAAPAGIFAVAAREGTP